MTAIAFRLRFITPCLGNRRRGEIECMPKDASGTKVVFMSSWWRGMLAHVALSDAEIKLVHAISWGPEVQGPLGMFERNCAPVTESGEVRTATKVRHEAFVTGTIVEGRALLPDALELATFERLLREAGSFLGISPYGHLVGFGRFEVLSVAPLQRLAR